MPMCLLQFWFESGAPPMPVLVVRLHAELGSHARLLSAKGEGFFAAQRALFEQLEVQRDRVVASSMSALPLIYFTKVCQQLGGLAVSTSKPLPRQLPVPDWARAPWTTYSWFAKLKIRLSGMRAGWVHGSGYRSG